MAYYFVNNINRQDMVFMAGVFAQVNTKYSHHLLDIFSEYFNVKYLAKNLHDPHKHGQGSCSGYIP